MTWYSLWNYFNVKITFFFTRARVVYERIIAIEHYIVITVVPFGFRINEHDLCENNVTIMRRASASVLPSRVEREQRTVVYITFVWRGLLHETVNTTARRGRPMNNYSVFGKHYQLCSHRHRNVINNSRADTRGGGGGKGQLPTPIAKKVI